jgi:hypothetical protein
VLASRGVLALSWVAGHEIERVALAVGAQMCYSVAELCPDVLGTAGIVCWFGGFCPFYSVPHVRSERRFVSRCFRLAARHILCLTNALAPALWLSWSAVLFALRPANVVSDCFCVAGAWRDTGSA